MNQDKPPTPPADDWRRQGQDDDLTGVTLSQRPWAPHRPGWDHDHCEFCWAKFSAYPNDLTAGYCTDDGYRWICEPCFNDFRAEFGWTLANNGPPREG